MTNTNKPQHKIMAGQVLTKKLISKVDKAAYQFGGFEIKGEIMKKTFLNLNAKTTVFIPAKYIKGAIDKFLSEFETTMNSWYFKIELI